MQNKQNTKAKVIVIAIAILLCLALVVGITGAFYQARRRATGTVKMDKGIVIDYTGFGKTPNEGTWLRETTISFKLFEDADVQPGEKISLNDAGIKANASSVDFYARVKLDYEFYNGETKLETLPASFKASDLITTSSTFYGSDWVDSGAGDGYYYYATGTTLNKFTSSAPATFVDLFDTNARFIIEGVGFTGAYPDGEGGGFVVGDTSINKIVVYLTLETLQGDATAEQAQALGWEIVASAGDVVFADATAKLETSVGKVETTENLNVSVGGAAEVPLSEVVFPYDTTTTLKFDSNNVEYVTLTYSNGESETFSETAVNTYEVYANSTKGTVTAYTVGLWSSSEYTGFTYLTTNKNEEDGYPTYEIAGGIAVAAYFGNATEITIPSSAKVRTRDFKLVLSGYQTYDNLCTLIESYMMSFNYKLKMTSKVNREFNSFSEFNEFLNSEAKIWDYAGTDDATSYFGDSITFSYSILVETDSILGSIKNVKEIEYSAFYEREFTKVTISEGIEVIGDCAFGYASDLTEIILPSTLKKIGYLSFSECTGLTTLSIPENLTYIGDGTFSGCTNLTTTIGDIGGTWVKESDNSEIDPSTLLKNVSCIKRIA